MRILLTNDDGIFAPGLAAIRKQLINIGTVEVVAPAVEQSGVGHSITFLSPLIAKEVNGYDGVHGWAVEGSPADCVKLAMTELCTEKPDLIISGINGGLNGGINTLYSGTVAAATEGALYGVPSIALSLEYDEHANFERAAEILIGLIQDLLNQKDFNKHLLYSINVPTAAITTEAEVVIVPMAAVNWPTLLDERRDPKGRRYYWASCTPPDLSSGDLTDVSALADGKITVTPLSFDRTASQMLERMSGWKFSKAKLQK